MDPPAKTPESSPETKQLAASREREAEKLGQKQPKPLAETFNGFGTMIYGKRNPEPDGSFLTTKWVVCFWIPLIPLRSLRVKYVGAGERTFWPGWSRKYLVLAESKPDVKQIISVYSFLVFFVLGLWILDEVRAGDVASCGALIVWASIPWFMRRWGRRVLETLRTQIKLFAVVGGLLFVLCGGALALHYYYTSREYAVRGEVFRVTKSGSGPEMASGAKIHVFRTDLPNKYEWWLNSTESLKDSEVFRLIAENRKPQSACSGVFDALDRQFADTPDHIGLQFMYRPYATSAVQEWHEIESDPDFQALSRSRKTAVRRVFWDRRMVPIALDDAAQHRSTLEGAQQQFYKTFFRDELPQGKAPPIVSLDETDKSLLDFLKRQSQEEIITAQTAADSQGQFSVRLRPGRYVVTSEGQMKKREWTVGPPGGPKLESYTTTEEAVWIVPMVVEGDTRAVLSEPICDPRF